MDRDLGRRLLVGSAVDMMVFLVQAGTIKHVDIIDSLRRFGREVIPQFRNRKSATAR